MKKTYTIKKNTAMVMATMMILNGSLAVGMNASAEELETANQQTVGIEHEAVQNSIPETPEKPQADSYKDNDKINEYNKQVDTYNAAAIVYNAEVDSEYEKAVEETNRKNEEIDKLNAAEEQRVQEETAASEAQYEADMAQYQKEYDTFKIMEGKILAAGYASVEQYNALINQRYNEPAKAAAEKNAATQVTIKDTYSIQEAEVKSGRLIPVSIKHSFEDTSLNYTEEFEIDANDIITFNSINAAVETTSLGYGFYYHTDDDHQIGYWWESFSSVGTNAVYHLNSWNSGDSHSISFKDGTKRASDIEDIVVEYYYAWNPLRTAKTYHAPEAPQKSEVAAASLLKRVADPVKKAYLSLLDHMGLFDEPEFAEEITVPAAPAAQTPADPTTVNTTANSTNTTAANTSVNQAAAVKTANADAVIDDAQAPLAAHAQTVEDVKIPKAAAETGSWALINLLSAIGAGLMSLILLIGCFGRKEDEQDENAETVNRKRGVRVASLIPAIGAAIAFILTENMTLKMQLTDRWTIMMLIILAIQVVVALMAKTSKDEEEKDVETIKVNA